jgi:hypothetical protein
MRFSMVPFVPLLLCACSNTVTSTRDGQSTGDPKVVQDSAPRSGTHEHTVRDHDDPITELRASCASRLNDLAVDAEIAPGENHAEIAVESHAVGDADCADFAWIRGFAPGAALIEPAWGGPDRETEWDCNHSSLEYGVYRRGGGDWQYVGGGLAYGNLDDGSCGYSVDNFPEQYGSDSVLVQGDPAVEIEPIEVRVAVRAWTHNDPAYGHSGNDCASMSCYWSAGVHWEAD